ncbi:NAD(P)/FAD-dependent oxidoreductase [Bradyrhizobium sp. USDA 329]|uniref:NAD(P)/FAD-dependent oxidoreductase n=1 Tax=unclassified Bradyrhizobium TaxID=2631580 RepID=UPI0035111E46
MLIIGGGVAGLLAAHALADRFERVTIVERDHYRDPNDLALVPRRGVPQSRCVHLLMAAGAAAFEQLIPGWSEQMGAHGAGPFDASAHSLLHLSTGRLPRSESGITAYGCSRALMESVLRRSLAKTTTVQVREGQKVVGLLAHAVDRRVIGVRTTGRQAVGEVELLADLVVDASGAGSILPRWIESLLKSSGSRLETTVTNCRMQYASRWFTINPDNAPDWRCLSIAPTETSRGRAAMMLRAENDRWGVVLLSPTGPPLPAEDDTFLKFTSNLGDGELRAALAVARPLSPIHRYAPTPNRVTHFHLLPAWPEGLVAIGDAVCTVDPYFGLGMTLSARGAALLRNCLDQQGDAFSASDFQNKLAGLNLAPWRLATGRDYDGQSLSGRAPLPSSFYDKAPAHSETAHAVLAVQHLLRPAETLKEVAP